MYIYYVVGVVSRRRVWLVAVAGIYGCDQQDVGSRMWVDYMGVASGCGCKEVYRFPHITYPYSSCICSLFAAAALLFVHLKKCFCSCIYMYITIDIILMI